MLRCGGSEGARWWPYARSLFAVPSLAEGTGAVPIAQLELPPVMIEQVEDRLMEAIVEGTLTPGQRLTQDGVASMLGVSRQPVSHALQALKRRGLVVEHGKRGLAVAPLDGAHARNLYQVRSALDGLAAQLAAQRILAGAAEPFAVEEARRALAEGIERSPGAPVRELVALDVAFHTAIYRLSGNSAIEDAVSGQWPHFRRSMRVSLEEQSLRTRVWAEHAAILDAILAGKAQGAAELSRRHTLDAGEMTATRLERLEQPIELATATSKGSKR